MCNFHKINYSACVYRNREPVTLCSSVAHLCVFNSSKNGGILHRGISYMLVG